MTRVGLVFGGRSAEHEVSVTSARTIAAALEGAGHEVLALGLASDGSWVSAEQSEGALAGQRDRLTGEGGNAATTLPRLLEAGAEVLFPIVHGTWGEDGCLQGLAEMLDLPYVGCDVAASAVCMDKHRCKVALAAADLPVVAGVTISAGAFRDDAQACREHVAAADLGWPVFVKPTLGGSSVGVTKVATGEDLMTALAGALAISPAAVVERGVEGRELECAVLGHRGPRASVIGEIVAGRDFYDYADKYLEDSAQLLAPAPLPEAVAERLRGLALQAFEAVGGSGMARVDFFWEPATDEVWINEINTLPGFTAISMYPRLWELTGVPRPQLVDELLTAARERVEERRQIDLGIRRFLQSLGGP